MDSDVERDGEGGREPRARAARVARRIGRLVGLAAVIVEGFSGVAFVGYVPQLATATWVGDPRGGFAHPLRDVTIAGQRYPEVYGGTVPAAVWHDTMAAALRGVPVRPLASLRLKRA